MAGPAALPSDHGGSQGPVVTGGAFKWVTGKKVTGGLFMEGFLRLGKPNPGREVLIPGLKQPWEGLIPNQQKSSCVTLGPAEGMGPSAP